ncbi:hypothetical protein IAT38_004460 [Cryptococcus sp. DSM 104549]
MLLRQTSLVARAHRAIHTRAHTFYSPTPDFLRQHLAQHPVPPNSTSLFLLSTSLPDLPQHLSTLQAAFPSHIGSFHVTPPTAEPTLSLAVFSDDEVRQFRSELSGRPAAEVGRFQRPEKQRETWVEIPDESKQGDAEKRLAGEGWAGMWRGESQAGTIPELEGVKASSFLLLSDGRPAPVLSALDTMFPDASKAGILTAPTPFITNRPHTLIKNGQIHSSGTLGLAFAGKPAGELVEFGLSPMADPVQIAAAQGNMLLEISGANSNPTQVLISAIQKRGGTGITKEEDFYLALLKNGDIKRVVKIGSGDPSRGALSVEMEEPLLIGQTVQFMHRSSIIQHPTPTPGEITFAAIPRAEEVDDVPRGEPRVVDGFLGLSESGFIYSNPASSVCTAAGAFVTIV